MGFRGSGGPRTTSRRRRGAAGFRRCGDLVPPLGVRAAPEFRRYGAKVGRPGGRSAEGSRRGDVGGSGFRRCGGRRVVGFRRRGAKTAEVARFGRPAGFRRRGDSPAGACRRCGGRPAGESRRSGVVAGFLPCGGRRGGRRSGAWLGAPVLPLRASGARLPCGGGAAGPRTPEEQRGRRPLGGWGRCRRRRRGSRAVPRRTSCTHAVAVTRTGWGRPGRFRRFAQPSAWRRCTRR